MAIFNQDEITCLTKESIAIGTVVETQTDGLIAADGDVNFPVVQAAGTTGRVLGVAMTAADGTTTPAELTVRLWTAGTHAITFAIDAVSDDIVPGVEVYIDGSGHFTDDPIGTNVGITVVRIRNNEDQLARCECLILRQDIQ